MIYHTKELTILVRPDDIIEIKTNENFKDTYSLEAVEENLTVFKKAVAGKTRATLLHFPEVYVNKEVMKRYANTDLYTTASALLAKSFASKLVGNIFLSLRQRFSTKLNNRPTKVFTDKEAAIKWLLEQLAQAKNKPLR